MHSNCQESLPILVNVHANNDFFGLLWERQQCGLNPTTDLAYVQVQNSFYLTAVALLIHGA